MADDPNSWLRAAIRQSRTITHSSQLRDGDALVSTTDSFNPGKDPRLAKIVQGVHFTRKFILTYNAVLLFILLAFAAFEWSGYIRRARSRRIAARKLQHGRSSAAVAQDGVTSHTRPNEAESGTSSSSSSTLEGTATPPNAQKKAIAVNEQGERQPLIPNRHQPKKSGYMSIISANSRAFLAYQPKPIPIVNKALPSNGQSLAILAFLGLNIFYLLFRVPFSVFTLFVFADRTGSLFAANLPLLYLFAAKNQPITWLTGYSYESLNIIHRRLGELMCALALVHFIGMLGVWYTLLVPFGFTFTRFITSHLSLFGLGAFICYELLYFTSLGSFRQRWYELFLFLHVFLQAGALTFLYLHHPGARIYVGIALAIFLVDRIVYRLALKMTTKRVDLTVLEDKNTVMVSGNWALPAPNRLKNLLNPSVNSGWNPTDHVFLTVPAISHKHIIQAHPFTIASAAPSPSPSPQPSSPSSTPSPHAWFNLLIRAQSGFSADLVRYAHTHRTASVRLDGPYGSAHPLALLQSADLAVIVAGGSGIAVAFPLAWALLNPASRSDVESQGGVSANTNNRKVSLIWIIRERAHLSWLPEERIEELRAWGGEVVVPAATEEAGRPEVGELVRERVCRLDASGDVGRAGVVCSGPDGLNREVRNECARLMGEGRRVGVSVEKFGW